MKFSLRPGHLPRDMLSSPWRSRTLPVLSGAAASAVRKCRNYSSLQPQPTKRDYQLAILRTEQDSYEADDVTHFEAAKRQREIKDWLSRLQREPT